MAYLEWVAWRRLAVMWSFDTAYEGDVYIYAMERKGFSEQAYLRFIHALMRLLHWPLFLLSVATSVMLLARWPSWTTGMEYRPLLVCVLAFVYFLVVLWLVAWLPRYTIPLRPISYVLACAMLSYLASFASIGSLRPAKPS